MTTPTAAPPGTQDHADDNEAKGCYDSGLGLLPAAVAERRILAATRAIDGREKIPTRDALQRILQSPVIAPLDVPGHTNSAMDGYALRAVDLPEKGQRRLAVAGTARAGAPFREPVTKGWCVRIMTGAPLPPGCDTVIMQEQVNLLPGGACVEIGPGHRAGQHVRLAGEDLKAGARVLPAGMRLMGAELGLIASLGISQVAVKPKLKVAFFSTGDELHSLGEPLADGAVYDSNRYTLLAMLSRLNVEIMDMGVVRYRKADMAAAFRQAADSAHVLITSGGASTGEADYVAHTLQELGQVGFWRIAIRPGRPLAFGHIGETCFFGLPGNPVAVMVTFYQFVQPALRRLAGELDPRPTPLLRAVCTTPLRKKPGRTEYYRAVLERNGDGQVTVRQTGKPGSGLLHTMSDANCFIVLKDEAGAVASGEEVDVQPFFGVM